MITKDDIARIVKVVQSMSVKDSSFVAADKATDGTKFTVVQDNKNKLVTAVQLLSYVAKNIDASSIPVSVPGMQEKDLAALLRKLYELAGAPHGDLDAITPYNIPYTNEKDESIDSIGTALNTIIDVFVSKADLITTPDGDFVNPGQLPGITLMNIEPVDEPGTKAGIWLVKTELAPVLVYRASVGTGFEDTTLGIPADSFYYYNGTIYHYNTSTGAFEDTIHLNDKADLSDGMLHPDQWPKVVINNIDGDGDANAAVGDVVYRSSTRNLYLIKSSGDGTLIHSPLGSPKPTTVYCLKSTDALYRWTGATTTSPWKLITTGGGSNVTVENNGIVLGKSSSGGSGNAPNVTPGGVDVVKTFYINSSTYSTYEITKGMIQKDAFGHYSSDQYKTMYKNAKGFTDAIRDAHDAGYTRIVVEKGDYCFTPIYNAGNSVAAVSGYAPMIWILNISDMDIDMGGSTFHLMVDSTEHSSYYRANSSAYKYHGCVIGIGQSNNITIRNGYFRGDWYTRNIEAAFGTAETEQESCVGINIGICPFTYNISLINLDGSGFSADFIIMYSDNTYWKSAPYWDRVDDTNQPDAMIVRYSEGIKGVMNYGYGFTDGDSAVTKTTNTSTNRYGISGFHHVGDWNTRLTRTGYDYARKELNKKDFSIRSAGGNYRLGNCYNPQIEILTYASIPDDVETPPLRVIKTGYYQDFHLYENEEYIRVQFIHEDGLNTGYYRSTGLSTLEDAAAYFRATPTQADANGGDDAGGTGPLITIVSKLNGNVLIEGCCIHDNARGGISGGANNVAIRRCEFMKQQYIPTASEQGTFPVYFKDSTNYSLDWEDAVANNLLVEQCTFYSGHNTGKLIFPTVLHLEFLNNTCYRCAPSVTNNFYTNVSGNTFHGSGMLGAKAWASSDSSSVSKQKVMRVMHYSNNAVYNGTSPGFSDHTNTVQLIDNCYIEIAEEEGTAIDALNMSNPNASKPAKVMDLFMTIQAQNRVFTNCCIKFLTNTKNAYFSYLKNCRIEGGTEWYVSRIEDCELVNSAFKIVHNLQNTDGLSAHLYIKNVRGLDFRSVAYPFQESTLTTGVKVRYPDYDVVYHDYVVHYENCTIDISKITAGFLLGNTTSSIARVYKDTYLMFKNCQFVGQASTSALESNTSEHKVYVSFDQCSFDTDSEYLFGQQTFTKSYRYFEFDKCRFNTDGFTLASAVDLVCGGECGTTTNRPKLTKPGSMYFDTTVGKPVWRSTALQDLSTTANSGVDYVDATGNDV